MTKPAIGFFWLSVTMFLLFAGATFYCARHGVTCGAGVIMMLYWLILAWGHARRTD